MNSANYAVARHIMSMLPAEGANGNLYDPRPHGVRVDWACGVGRFTSEMLDALIAASEAAGRYGDYVFPEVTGGEWGCRVCPDTDEHGARVSKDVAALSEGLHHLLRHEDHSALGMRAIGRALWYRALDAGLLGDDEDFPHPDVLEAMGRDAMS